MSPRRMFASKAGWASAAAVLVVAGVLTGTMLANAAGPALPKRTPAQLLVAMHNAKPPAAMTAVITENANLGFPSLPDIAGLQSSVFSAASAITGTHTVEVWYDGPRHVRIAVPVSFGETDLRVNGNQVWLWNSHGQTATHYILPAHPLVQAVPKQVLIPSARMPSARLRLLPPRAQALRRCLLTVRAQMRPVSVPAHLRARILKCLHSLKIGTKPVPVPAPLTPQQAATKFLAAIGPTTNVTVAGSTTVAGRSAYQLVIAPRTNQSLISQIVIAVDSKTYLPLQLAVFAQGVSGPAFQVGFTSLSFSKPAASNFTFTPPAGAHVKTEKLADELPGFLGGRSAMAGLPAPLPGPFTSQRFLPHGPSQLKVGAVNAKRWLVVASDGNAPYASVSGQIIAPSSPIDDLSAYASAAYLPASPLGGLSSAASSGVQVLGQGWLSVAVLPAGDALSALSGPAKRPIPNSSSGSGPHPLFAPPGAAQGNQIPALLRILLNSAAKVHGTWGSGRLLTTNLFSVLVTNNGKVLIGAVTPDVLYADAAKVK